MDSFYMHLPSNVVNPSANNTVANHITFFSEPISLDGQYDVALKEFHFPLNWVSFDKNELSLMVLDFGMTRLQRRENKDVSWTHLIYQTNNASNTVPYHLRHLVRFDKSTTHRTLPIKPYKINDLFNLLSQKYSNIIWLLEPIKFEWAGNRVKITAGKTVSGEMVFPLFDRRIVDLLGLPDTVRDNFEGSASIEQVITGTLEVKDRDETQRQVYVYSDIVQPIFVGDKRYQLLRIAQVPDVKYGSNIVHYYTDAYYIPVQGRQINSIEINLKFDDNETILFAGGRSLVVLHFRKAIKG